MNLPADFLPAILGVLGQVDDLRIITTGSPMIFNRQKNTSRPASKRGNTGVPAARREKNKRK